MAFSTEKAKEKLKTLSNTQQSIQSTSQWCLFHTKHAKNVVSVWNSQFNASNSTPEYRLALFYLCNDILQLARPKMERHALFFSSFKAVLPTVLANVTNSNGDNIGKYSRVLDVWKQRSVYDEGTIRVFKNSLESPSKSSSSGSRTILTNNSSGSPNTNIAEGSIPDPIKPMVGQYSKLETLTKKFKGNYSKFHTSSTVVLKSDVESDIPQLLILGKEIETDLQTLSKLRTDISSEMRKIAAELDDWQMLDQQKLQNVKLNVKQLQEKLDAIEAFKVQQAVLAEADDDDMPVYDDDAEDESPKYDSDDEDKQKEPSGGDFKRQKTDSMETNVASSNSALQSLNSILEQLS